MALYINILMSVKSTQENIIMVIGSVGHVIWTLFKYYSFLFVKLTECSLICLSIHQYWPEKDPLSTYKINSFFSCFINETLIRGSVRIRMSPSSFHPRQVGAVTLTDVIHKNTNTYLRRRSISRCRRWMTDQFGMRWRSVLCFCFRFNSIFQN